MTEETPKKKRKQRRRAPGEGSVYQRKSDLRWVAKIPLEDGSYKEYYFKRQEAAVKKLHQAQYEKSQGILATGPQQTVKQYMEYWLEEMHRSDIRRNTYVLYRGLLKNHVLPALGHIKLQKLMPEDIQVLYARMQKEEYAAETVRAIHRMLHKALSDAVDWSRVSRNVCDKVKQPRPSEYEYQTLTKDQALKLIAVAKGTYLETLILLAIVTGMREGELLGLKWGDMDFEEGSLTIKRKICRIHTFGLVEEEPKTKQGNHHKILLPQFALDALVVHRTRQKELRMKAGPNWREQDILLSNTTGGYIQPQNMIDKFKRFLAKAGLPEVRFHDLRHSAATILLGMGIHPKLVQELLGHTNINITMGRYSHVLPTMQREMMDQIDRFFKES